MVHKSLNFISVPSSSYHQNAIINQTETDKVGSMAIFIILLNIFCLFFHLVSLLLMEIWWEQKLIHFLLIIRRCCCWCLRKTSQQCKILSKISLNMHQQNMIIMYVITLWLILIKISHFTSRVNYWFHIANFLKFWFVSFSILKSN